MDTYHHDSIDHEHIYITEQDRKNSRASPLQREATDDMNETPSAIFVIHDLPNRTMTCRVEESPKQCPASYLDGMNLCSQRNFRRTPAINLDIDIIFVQTDLLSNCPKSIVIYDTRKPPTEIESAVRTSIHALCGYKCMDRIDKCPVEKAISCC
ncbi:hypothetical protein OCU04_000080 [Sclerotinia nivalis]|uniref:Uncharacterized protein n=1 Tax=Sclerotinia nivalis TaxID=352851 RepID=A0A9X0DPZ0_9HELO|nr:hypothetical protein OCU04_000080 [Sclerotinia nivalis]